MTTTASADAVDSRPTLVPPPTATALADVVVLALEPIAPFELGVLCEVFGIDRSDQGLPVYDFAVCGVRPGRVAARGFDIVLQHGLDRLESADLIAVPAYGNATSVTPISSRVRAALRAAHARGAMVMSVCSGAFALAAAGLLDGRRCTTHWMYADQFAERYPLARLEPDVLYVEDGNIFTSAGTAAGIDLCLHIVREHQGSAVANAIARRMVVPPHRDGGQAQFVDLPMPASDDDDMQPLLEWMVEHLADELSVDELAARVHLSSRTFARRFRAATGTTPHHWLTGQRVLRAQHLLEQTNEPIERVASQVGFGNAATLRHHFGRWRGTTPVAFRRAFRTAS
jgi:transcriptional regulator GlxA family with amidase domain